MKTLKFLLKRFDNLTDEETQMAAYLAILFGPVFFFAAILNFFGITFWLAYLWFPVFSWFLLKSRTEKKKKVPLPPKLPKKNLKEKLGNLLSKFKKSK